MEGVSSLGACLSRSAIDQASFPRRSIVSTGNRDASNFKALIKFLPCIRGRGEGEGMQGCEIVLLFALPTVGGFTQGRPESASLVCFTVCCLVVAVFLLFCSCFPHGSFPLLFSFCRVLEGCVLQDPPTEYSGIHMSVESIRKVFYRQIRLSREHDWICCGSTDVEKSNGSINQGINRFIAFWTIPREMNRIDRQNVHHSDNTSKRSSAATMQLARWC